MKSVAVEANKQHHTSLNHFTHFGDWRSNNSSVLSKLNALLEIHDIYCMTELLLLDIVLSEPYLFIYICIYMWNYQQVIINQKRTNWRNFFAVPLRCQIPKLMTTSLAAQWCACVCMFDVGKAFIAALVFIGV